MTLLYVLLALFSGIMLVLNVFILIFEWGMFGGVTGTTLERIGGFTAILVLMGWIRDMRANR